MPFCTGGIPQGKPTAESFLLATLSTWRNKSLTLKAALDDPLSPTSRKAGQLQVQREVGTGPEEGHELWFEHLEVEVSEELAEGHQQTAAQRDRKLRGSSSLPSYGCGPFNTVLHATVLSTVRLFLLLLHNCQFATGMNHSVNIQYARSLIWDPCDPQRGQVSQVENCRCSKERSGTEI